MVDAPPCDRSDRLSGQRNAATFTDQSGPEQEFRKQEEVFSHILGGSGVIPLLLHALDDSLVVLSERLVAC